MDSYVWRGQRCPPMCRGGEGMGEMMKENDARFGRKLLIIGFWLLVWQLGAFAVDNPIILVGPWETVLALGRLIPDRDFWRSIAYSFGRIAVGFGAAFGAGIILGSCGYALAFVRDLLEPVMTLLKSIPVASFVILALIWAGSGNLSVLIAFIVVLPMIYVNTLAGLGSTDRKLLEMAEVFRMPMGRKIRYIYVPALLPYLKSGCRIALGMCWKSGVAAEVIGVPDHSIGEKLYMAKIYLDTGDVLAWTLVIILVSIVFERAVLGLLGRLAPGGGRHESDGA